VRVTQNKNNHIALRNPPNSAKGLPNELIR
jgi:hypothetical protein